MDDQTAEELLEIIRPEILAALERSGIPCSDHKLTDDVLKYHVRRPTLVFTLCLASNPPREAPPPMNYGTLYVRVSDDPFESSGLSRYLEHSGSMMVHWFLSNLGPGKTIASHVDKMSTNATRHFRGQNMDETLRKLTGKVDRRYEQISRERNEMT